METAAKATMAKLKEVIVSLKVMIIMYYDTEEEREEIDSSPPPVPVPELGRSNSDSGPNIIGCAVSSRIYRSSK